VRKGRVRQELKGIRFDGILIGRGVGIVDCTEAYVEIFLEEDTIALTIPWLMRVGDSDIEIPEEL
jgi:hypothetical protein